MSTIKIFLNGCNGRMGKVITEICQNEPDLTIVAGADANAITSESSSGLATFPQYVTASNCQDDFDVIIDFSHVSAVPAIIDFAKTRNKPLIMCTTGLTEEHKAALAVLSQSVAVFYSANMSLGINILVTLAQKAAEILYPNFDLEIVEAHHNQKLDAPSGTALMIADALNETLDHQLEYVYDRHNALQKREKKELGLHSIRGGTIVGEHSVIFAGPEEVLTISHSAQSRNVFARGSVAAARFIYQKPAGMYSMKELIG